MEDLTTLVVQIQQGQTEAFEGLVRRFQDMAVGYAYSLLGDIHRAEDAAQEAFIAAYFDIAALRNPAAFPGWFRRIVFKHADRLRRGQQALVLPLNEESRLAAPSPDPAEAAEASEFQAAIRTTVATLDDRHREVVLLFYIGEHSLQEISIFLEIPLGTVKSRLHTARKQLHERMIEMMHKHLPNQRPSRDEEFANKVTQLFRAMIEGKTSQVSVLLSQDQRLANANGFVGSSLWQSDAPALHVAVMHGRKDLVDLLLEHGADINARDEEWKFTALHQAIDLSFIADYARLGMVDFLLERGAEKDVFAHLWLGEYDQAKAVIERDPALVNALGPNNLPPLCYANEDMAVFLMTHGADAFMPLACNLGFSTPLRWLAGDNQRMFSFLLGQLGMALDVFLHCALGHADDISRMIAADPELVHARTASGHVLEPDLTLLHIAAQYGHLAIVQHLLLSGADVNALAPAVMHMTPLHLAVWQGSRQAPEHMPDGAEVFASPGVLLLKPDMPRLLLEHGADVAARDDVKQLTPLGWAEANHGDEVDRSQVATLLREFGAEV